jgi:acetylornithine deacetylase/succinyl-diaminopimelate desuccinylase-like protein
VRRHLRARAAGALEDLQAFVRIPSVSAQARHERDVRAAADWLAARLRRAGLPQVTVVRTARHPLVLAAWREAPGRPTVLVYGHYDVQPVDPLGEWRSPPFAAEVRGPELFGRGASDDKGQLLCHVEAIEALLRSRGRLPVNVVCLFEGEEEIGSPNLRAFLQRHQRHLTPDVAVASDTRMLGPDRPALTYALRGSLALELEVRGADADLHSGTFGGAVHNPLQALCELIASLHDPQGRVLVPGFYDYVHLLSRAERAEMRRVGPTDAEVVITGHGFQPWGSRGGSLYERTTAWPALTLNGLTGGYQGPGAKSVIPAVARAKLGVRLVADQDPAEILRALRQFIARRTPPTIQATLRPLSAAPPVVLGRAAPPMAAAAAAYSYGFGALPVPLRSGGTIPAVALFQEVLGVDTVLMGFALPTDGTHAPNEKFHLPTFYRGIRTAAKFLDEVAIRTGIPPDGSPDTMGHETPQLAMLA